MNELKKYEIAARIQEEAERRSKDKLIEEKFERKTDNINKSIRQMIAEALLEDESQSPTCPQEEKIPKKIKDSIEIVRVMSNVLYQIQDSYSSYNTVDEEIKKILLENNSKAVDICLKKLNNIWQEKKDEPTKEESTKEEKKEEPAKEEVTNMMNQIMSVIAKNEEVRSPSGDIFIIEESNENMARVRNKVTTKKYNVETKVLKTWIEEKR